MTVVSLSLRVGRQTFGLRLPEGEALDYLRRAYAACRGEADDETDRFTLACKDEVWQVDRNGVEIARGALQQVVWLLEWDMARRAVTAPAAGASFHAGWVERDGEVLMLAGAGGAGKSRLCLQLLERGFRLGAEDVTFFDEDRVVPFPRAIQIRPTDPVLAGVPASRVFPCYDGRACVDVAPQDAAGETEARAMTIAFLDPALDEGPARILAPLQGLQGLFGLCHRLDRVGSRLFETVAALAVAQRMFGFPGRIDADVLLAAI